MTDLLQTGAAFLTNELAKYAARQVTYQRGTDSVTLSATLGRTEYEQADESGLVMLFQSRDYLVRTADLILSSVAIMPEPGDRIVETVAGQDFVYEVAPLPSGAHYKFCDSYRLMLRIHTKQVA